MKTTYRRRTRAVFTLTQIASETGISLSHVRELMRDAEVRTASDGVEGYWLRDAITAYVEDIEAAAAQKGRSMTVKERKELADAVAKEAKNKIMLKEYVAVSDVVSDQARLAGTVARMLDSIVGRVHREVPELTPEILTEIGNEVSRIRNEYVNSLEGEALEEVEEDDMDDEELGAFG